MAMKVYLIVAKGKRQGLSILIRGDLFLIGSGPACQLRSNRPGVAPQHCALVTRERKVFIRDLNGGEPTLVNDDVVPPAEEWPVHKGDRLTVGPLEFQIQFREKAPSKRDTEEWALRYLDTAAMEEHQEFGVEAKLTRETPSGAAASILEQLSAQRGVVKGRLRIAQESGVTIVRFTDRQMMEEPEIAFIKKELTDYLPQAAARVLLDFKNVHRMSSLAVGMIFLWLQSQLRARGATLAVCRLRDELLPILETLGVLKQVPYFPDKQAALDAQW
jgi:anti-anti-sigma regulatory factor/pSer/pThr/pTyr-binding forkhead associated (FHA) protein